MLKYNYESTYILKFRRTMSKIILFYKYVYLENPTDILKWQRQICESLNLKGRIILATEGINATLGGTDEEISKYINFMNSHPLFDGIDFKESIGGAEYFPRLRIVVKQEIVNLGINPQELTTQNTGKHLTPEQTHQLLQNKPEDLIILDGRNNYEAAVGQFEDAITPDIRYFRQFPEYIDQNLEQFKDKQVLMYCTGGIRCERASAYLKSKGIAKEVYQVEGGIHRYVEQFPDGFFKGKNYVFDARITMQVNNVILGKCLICKTSCDDYMNCLNAECNKHFIGCKDCVIKLNETCSDNCNNLVAQNKVRTRPKFNKLEAFKLLL